MFVFGNTKTNVFFTSREQFGRFHKVGMCVVPGDSIHESRLRAGRKNFERPLVNPHVCACVRVCVCVACWKKLL